MKRSVNSTTTNYLYSGSVVISEKQGSSWTDYIFFGNQRIAQQSGAAPITSSTSATTAKYVHADHLGSTRRCTDSNGNSNGSCDYEPFGEFQPGSSCSNLPTNYRFAGMEYDSETALYRTIFRQYDPNQGRWMSLDPLPGSASDPQSLDRYAYVLDDPINLVDPLGLQCHWEQRGRDANGNPIWVLHCEVDERLGGGFVDVFPCVSYYRNDVYMGNSCHGSDGGFERPGRGDRPGGPGGPGPGTPPAGPLPGTSPLPQQTYQDCIKSFGRAGSLLAEYGSVLSLADAFEAAAKFGTELAVERFAGTVAKNTAEHAFHVEANLVAKGIGTAPASQLFKQSTKALLVKVGAQALTKLSIAVTVAGTSLDAYCRLKTGGGPQ